MMNELKRCSKMINKVILRSKPLLSMKELSKEKGKYMWEVTRTGGVELSKPCMTLKYWGTFRYLGYLSQGQMLILLAKIEGYSNAICAAVLHMSIEQE
jgi:hypothetical protein